MYHFLHFLNIITNHNTAICILYLFIKNKNRCKKQQHYNKYKKKIVHYFLYILHLQKHSRKANNQM